MFIVFITAAVVCDGLHQPCFGSHDFFRIFSNRNLISLGAIALFKGIVSKTAKLFQLYSTTKMTDDISKLDQAQKVRIKSHHFPNLRFD